MKKLSLFLLMIVVLTLTATACQPKKVDLKASERTWVATHTVIMAPDPSWPPIEYFDASGHYQGLAADYLKLICDRTGLKLKIVKLESWDEIVKQAQKGRVDLMVGIYTPERARRHLYTEAFIDIPCVIIVNTNQSSFKSLADLKTVTIIKGHAIESFLHANYPRLQITYANDTSDGLRQASFNQTDAFVVDLPSASYRMDQLGITNLKVAGDVGFNYHLHFICNRNMPILRDLLNKGLANISHQEKRRIWRKWVSIEPFSTAIYQRMLVASSVVILVVLLLSLAFFIWNSMLRQQVSQRTAELNENRARLVSALTGASLTTWDIWLDSGTITLSTKAGEPPQSFETAIWLDRIHPDDLELVTTQLQNHLNGLSNFYECEYRLKVTAEQLAANAVDLWVRESAQQWRWVRARGSVTERNKDGSPRRVSGTLLDINQGRQAEETSRMLAQVIEQTVEGIIICTKAFTIEYFNPAIKRTLGYTDADLQGADLLDLLQDQTLSRQQIEADLNANKLFQGRLGLKRQPWGRVMVELTISPMADPTGSTTHYITVMRDITHELELERQLQQAHKMEALGTLAGGIAHDFNNILTPIIGYAEISREETSSPSLKEYMSEIIKAATRARDMVSHIQIFSRQSGQETSPISLQPVIKEALKLMRASIPSSITIESHISNECGPVLTNPTQIHQIIMNLCTNAYHAMEDSGGTLTVTLERKSGQPEGSPGSAVLIVSDTGSGIAPEIIERIFDPYFTTKEVGKGSGMGLAVVHGIVENAGGSIKVNSTPGQGSVFEIILPECMQEPAAGSQPSKTNELPTGHERVLLVDDEPAIARLIQQNLTSLGYAVTAVTASSEALATFKQSPERFDILITDMAMPGMTGTELIGAVHAIRPQLPVILCSGFSDELEFNKADGIKAIIMKPVIRADLAQALRKALD